MPLFETAASTTPIEATALVNITPGIFNNIEVGDRVFVAFEENAIENPIIIGKLFRGANIEGSVRGGGGIFNTLKVNSEAVLPATTSFTFPTSNQNEYKNFRTLKNIADYIKWLEKYTKAGIVQLDDNFRCFKNWAQWQLQPENVEIDDGDLDDSKTIVEHFKYQEENKPCKICDVCSKNNTRRYTKPDSTRNYPNT
jgi:uncharacterized protein involved in type VI secretion and phage assembly